MEKRDLLKDEIERFGRVIGQILASFIGLRQKGDLTEAVRATNERLKRELDLDIDKLLTCNKTELEAYVDANQLTDDHLTTLSAYLEEAGLAIRESRKEAADSYIQTAIFLLDIVDERSTTLSLDRVSKRNELQDLLR
ncbi:hypothetical protein [Lewinella sp. IMCC34191]|uniref:hypothetical protein n=1 Tax=Lewinella sp. IMCC34191 TaxID=2259172 RepID=UPI000E25A3B8|nr:hypothetical protein [Lewinella sp. IMCC34191]